MKKQGILWVIMFLAMLAFALSCTASPLDKEICPCGNATYAFFLSNDNNHITSYEISADRFEDHIRYAVNPISLAPGEQKTAYAHITPECSMLGNHSFSFYVGSRGKRARFPASLNIGLCSDFGVSFGELMDMEEELDFRHSEASYELCRGDIKKVPVMLINKGDIANNLFLSLKGEHASLSQKSAALEASQKGVVYINLEPKKAGEYGLFLSVRKQRGDVTKNYLINIDVQECYDAKVSLADIVDICGGEQESYEIIVENRGRFDEEFELSTDLSFGNIEPSGIEIGEGEESAASLMFTPGKNLSGDYPFSVYADISDKNFQAVKKGSVGVIPKSECYKGMISAAKRYSIEPLGDRIDLTLKNTGEKDSTFMLALEGPSWVKLSSDEIFIQQGKSKTLTIFADPPKDVKDGSYDLTVSMSKDDLYYPKNIAIEIKEDSPFDSLLKFLDSYMYYLIAGVALLALTLAIIAAFRAYSKRRKKKRRTKKELKIRIKPYLRWVLIAVFSLAAIGISGYLFYRFDILGYIVSYIFFISAGIALLFIAVVIIHLFRSRKFARKEKPAQKKSKAQKKEEGKKTHIAEIIEYLIILAIVIAVIYFVSRIEGISSDLMYYLNFAIMGFVVLVVLIMIINRFRSIKKRKKKEDKREEEKAVKKKKEEREAAKKEQAGKKPKRNYFMYSFWLLVLALVLLYVFNYAFHSFVNGLLAIPYAYLLDFFGLYYSYIIAGFVILFVLILLLKYGRRIMDFLMKED